jgi:hypothetical protein
VWHLHKQAPETTWLTHGLDWVSAGEFIAFLAFSCHGRAHVFKLTADLLASAADAIYTNLEGHVSTDSTLFKPLPFKRLDPAFKEQLAEAAKMHDLPLALNAARYLSVVLASADVLVCSVRGASSLHL